MITSARFRELLHQPEQIKEEDLPGLEWLTEKFPWFAAPRILLAHYHQREGLYSFNRMLKLASMYAGDRRKLYQTLHKDSFPETETPVGHPTSESGISSSEMVPVTPTEPEESLGLIHGEGPEPVEQIAESSSEPVSMASIEPVSEKELTSEEDFIEEQRADETASVSEIHPVNHSDEKSAEVTAYDPLIALRPFLDKHTDEEKSAKQDLLFNPVYDPEKELIKYLEEPEKSPEDALEENSEHDFLFWLNHTGKEAGESEDPSERLRNKIKKEASESIDLLDQFIRNRPQMKRPKAEFFKPEAAARKSESFESPIVSESLAKLLVKQGHFDQAIEVYQKLS
jgi:hypothetical protein